MLRKSKEAELPIAVGTNINEFNRNEKRTGT